MGEKQLIHLLQFIFAWILIWIFVVFVLEWSFVDFLLKYWLYLLIVCISYFYYYSIQYDLDDKSKIIRNVIIYGNLYLFAHIFFRPLLNISHSLFILLWLIILWVWRTTKLTTRWKYLMQIVWWIFWFFILISWIFYLYPNKPDIEWFIKSRSYEILVTNIDKNIAKKDAYIQIIDSKRSSDFDIIPDFEKQIVESCKISYPSKNTQRDEKVVIITPYWEIIWILPQSEIQLEFDNGKLVNLLKANWEIGYLSWIFDSSVAFSGGIELLSGQQDWVQWIQYDYKYDLVDYLRNQISSNEGILVNSSIMYKIDGKIIKWLARMFPASFTKNLRNYNEFQNYFSLVNKWENIWLGKYKIKQWNSWSFSYFWDNLVGNMEVWRENTYDIFKERS